MSDSSFDVLLVKGYEDLQTVRLVTSLSDEMADQMSDTIFGFHVQQAIEKLLKAWISKLGHTYPYTHDLRELIDLLAGFGCDVSDYQTFDVYSPYAATLRYVAYQPMSRLDRIKAIQDAELVYKHVLSLKTST